MAYETVGDERSIQFTVMTTSEDLKINAECIRMADQFIEVHGGSNNNYYANVSLIVDIAERTGVHAAWAGCKHKIVFIGPPGSVTRTLGDKISSMIVAQSANIPTMDWNGNDVTKTEFDEIGHVIVSESVGEFQGPSKGGGGKGIRKVENPNNFKQAFAQVQGEVPDSLTFIMRFVRDARHFEVQVEHTTTEMVSGVNLPTQLQSLLHQIRSEINFDFSDLESLQTQRRPAPKGHVIAVRITAENPDAGFKPSNGMVHELNFCSSTNVSRLIPPSKAFEENSFTTGWLDTLISDENLTAEKPDKVLAEIPSRYILRTVFIIDFIYEGVHYKFTPTRSCSTDACEILVESGDHVKKGDAYAEIEVMKMYMPIIAIEDVELVTRYLLGQLPAMNPPVLVGDKAHQIYCEVKHILECIIPCSTFSTLRKNPGQTLLRISNETHSQGLENPAKRLKKMFDNYSLDFVKPSDLSSFKSVIAPVNDILERYVCEEAVHALRDEYKNDLDKTFEKGYAQMEQMLKVAVIESHYGDDGYNYRTQVMSNWFGRKPSFFSMRRSASIPDLKRNIPLILKLFPKIQTIQGWKSQDLSDRNNINNVLNFTLRLEDDAIEDEALKKRLNPLYNDILMNYVNMGYEELLLSYFVKVNIRDYTEDQTIRHIEPAMAYQLELTRLSNFDITPCFTDNRQIHVYYAVGKENTSDCRFFIRSLVRPGRLRNSVRTADYLISESDRLLNEILDSLEIVSSEHKISDCNHLFINFIPTFELEPKQVEEAVKVLINRHGKRLWRLCVIGAEVRFKVEDPTLVTSYPLHVIINNVSVSNLECPSDVLEAKELVLDENNNIHEVEKASGTNSFEVVMNHFNVAWIDKGNPRKGIKYLYFDLETISNYIKMEGNTLSRNKLLRKEIHDKITDIIGSKDGLCVEGQHVILTGSPALNKVLGREVYTGNLQLGGTQIMLKNGVSHLTVQNDFGYYKGYAMSFLRSSRNSIFMNSDTLDRDVNYVPPRALRSKMYYKQPVFVYIVPMENFVKSNSESHNCSQQQKMYRNLKKSLNDPTISESQKREIKLQLDAREQELLPIHQEE
ncbi:8122_t:CDS:10 [Funneliformis geosporum]|uniref:8122_t:CDS:1 n=1 Tax=Funneliformis geosporum TaxID=1117311 RepID=A0A9W4X0L6_9GLOM|nr:8122_t:CDS:10 [Funneliformis geosporum]